MNTKRQEFKLFSIIIKSCIFSLLAVSTCAFAEYYTVYSAPEPCCYAETTTVIPTHRYHGCAHHKHRHKYHHRWFPPYKKNSYSVTVYHGWQMVPPCGCADACSSCCGDAFIPSCSYTYHEDYYDPDTRTADDVGADMDIDY